GIAREVSALFDLPLRPIDAGIDEALPPAAERVRIEIEDPKDTPRYAARLMEGVTIGEAPLRMQHRLIKVGMRPLSNVVDATNYVMLELGHPLHPFDADLVSEPIVIRRAHDREAFQTLDDVDRTLTSEVLMIADQQGGLALAGVMGGQRSEIRPETTRVLLESATFFGYTIRKSSRSVGLRSEASQRFERGIDPEGVPLAAARATHLIQKLTGCGVHQGIVDAYPSPSTPRTLRLRPKRAAHVLGIDVDQKICLDILARLQIAATPDGEAIAVTVPAFRPDLEREIDLIEEIGRVYGYDRLESSSPRSVVLVGRRDRIERDKHLIRDTLCGLGMNEVVGDGFDKRAWREALSLPADDLLTTVNPMTVGQSALRSSLLPAILEIVDANLRQGVDGGMIYELGRIFSRSRGEREALGGALFGRTGIPLRGKEMVSLPMARGILDGLFRALRLNGVTTRPDELPSYLHPGRGARFLHDGEELGHLGELAPALIDRFALATKVLVFAFDVPRLAANAEMRVRLAPLPQFPASKRDLSVSAPQGLAEETVRAAIVGAAGVESVLLYDVYRGEQVGGERVSLTYELAFRAADRTLTDADVDAVVRQIDARLKALDVHIRT
ncbi:phenylalanine--tRNA ligase subunit beta, partial [Candidatus Bipolaricaulota bacterium]|nr:phenylalanine--tRNA ligase subunit beta [Candidatus Bipolaricaulota bacterium]